LDGLDSSAGCVVELARDELTEAFETVRAARKIWKKSGEPEDLHQVRIALKRFRYGCEFHQEVFGGAMAAYIPPLKEVQSTLGEWNECRLLEEMVLILGNAAPYDIAQGAPLVAEAYGERAAVLEEQFVPLGKALLGKKGRKAFASLLADSALPCCDAR
jgi:CHAD domain-containing protein